MIPELPKSALRITGLIVFSSGCIVLSEEVESDSTVSWSGYVLQEFADTEPDVFTNGTLSILTTDGESISDGDQPWEDSPGFWSVDVPADTEVAIRIVGDPEAEFPAAPTVWRGNSPPSSGYWFNGSLFVKETSIVDDMLSSISSAPGTNATPLSDGTTAVLWGEPMEPEEWAGAEIAVTDADGASGRVRSFVIDDDGALSAAGNGPVDLFISYNLPPGPTTLHVTTAEGVMVETTWPAEAGDLLSAIYYALPDCDYFYEESP